LNPSIYNHTFIVQTRESSTHTSKTYFIAIADSSKLAEVLGFLNEKYKLTQTGPIRDKIWEQSDAMTFEENEYPQVKIFKDVKRVPTSIRDDELNILSWSVKEKSTGKIFFTYDDVLEKDGICEILFTEQDFSQSVDNVQSLCCLDVNTTKDHLHICSTETFRCETETNKIAKTIINSCNAYKTALKNLELYKNSKPVVTYDYLAYDQGKLLKDQFYSTLSLQYEEATEGATSMFSAYSYVVDLKDNQLRPRVSRLYIHVDQDTFEIRYNNTNNNYLIKHDLETLIPKCDIICNVDD